MYGLHSKCDYNKCLPSAQEINPDIYLFYLFIYNHSGSLVYGMTLGFTVFNRLQRQIETTTAVIRHREAVVQSQLMAIKPMIDCDFLWILKNNYSNHEH